MYNLLMRAEAALALLERQVTHLLLPFLKVERHHVIVRKATFGESQADTVGIGRATSAI